MIDFDKTFSSRECDFHKNNYTLDLYFGPRRTPCKRTSPREFKLNKLLE